MNRRDLIKFLSFAASGTAFAGLVRSTLSSPAASSITASPRTLDAGIGISSPQAVRAAAPVLPQKDTAAGRIARAGFLATQRLSYIWTEHVPTASGIPLALVTPQDLPTIEWLIKFIAIVVGVIENFLGSAPATAVALWRDQFAKIRVDLLSLENLYSDLTHDPNLQDPVAIAQAASIQAALIALLANVGVLSKDIISRLGEIVSNHDTRSEENFKALFSTFPLPDISAAYQRDDHFASLRVAGQNPVLIKRISGLPSKFPLTNAQFQQVMGPADNLVSAAAENRLYLLDYVDNGLLATSRAVAKPLTGIGYSYAPIALFALPRGGASLVPVAIQCDQDPATNPLFLPADPSQESAYWAWQMAKTVVQCAEENYHEMFVHLARTHLVTGAICVATHRNLASTHPLYALLMPHFEGTLYINELAALTLLPPLMFIDTLFAAPIQQTQQMVASDRLAFDFYDHMLPNDIEMRGVGAANLPDYPYRDDGLLIWNAIADWAKAYVDVYYKSDQDVVDDYELRSWAADIIANGKVKGFRPVRSKAQLIDVLTMIIFTASAQHAAVNFSQSDFSTYAPALSALLSAPAPTSAVGKSKADWLKMLPPLVSGIERVAIYEILAGVQHSALGQYRSNVFPYRPLITDPAITGSNGPLEHFRQALGDVESQINARNSIRKTPYEYLLPSRIPASTNI